jgi:hypothetical protein
MDNEYLLTKLYEHMKGSCGIPNHSGTAIYFCIAKQCHERYLCSECIIEKVDHFTNHIKTLVPLDNKSKFMKFLNINNVFTSNPGSRDNVGLDVRDKLTNLYNEIRQEVNRAIDLHMKLNIEELSRILADKGDIPTGVKESGTKLSNEVSSEIESFINYKNKLNFNELYETISIMLSKHNEEIANEKKRGIELKVNPDIVNLKVDEMIAEHLGPKKPVTTKQSTKEQQKLFTFSEEYDPDSRLNQTAHFDDISNFSKAMGFNRDFSVTFGRRDEILSSFNTEASEEDNMRRNNIKNRLNELKNKLGKLK